MMTPEIWRTLTPSHRAELWPQLSVAEKDSIIATDKNVLKEVAAETVENMHAAARPSTVSARPFDREPPRVRAHFSASQILADVRIASCYGTLRSTIAILTRALDLRQRGRHSCRTKRQQRILAALYIPVALAIRQGALLLADFVDLELQREAKARSKG